MMLCLLWWSWCVAVASSFAIVRQGGKSSSFLRATAVVSGPPTTSDEWFVLDGDPRFFSDSISVHYTLVDGGRENVPVVCLHGFGVGKYHFAGNLGAMASSGRKAYALDLIGQGQSWPLTVSGVKVGAETWIYQLESFLEKVVQEKALLAGNSLGGFLAACVAARRPDLVAGVCLLNAAPFWGFFPRFLQRLIWDSRLPAPTFASALGYRWFDLLRDKKTVRSLLKEVYAAEVTDQLVDSIINATEAPFGPDVFTSIIFSPPHNQTFDDSLRTIAKHRIPTALVYGEDDPWVFPAWGQRAYRRLDNRATYYELSNTGHCPNDESPRATNLCLNAFLELLDDQRKNNDSSLATNNNGEQNKDIFLLGQKKNDEAAENKRQVDGAGGGGTPVVVVQEADGREVIIRRVDGKPRTLLERAAKLHWG